jgi:hypothetical protein
MRFILSSIVVVLIAVSAAHAVEVGGVDMPNTLRVGNDKLVLNGAGVREKFFLDLYVGGLYLKEKASNAQQIIEADEPMAILVYITSGMITEKKMADATEEGFKRTTGGNTKPLQSKIDIFIREFSQNIKPNDIYELAYIPGKGVVVTKNGSKGATISDLEFKKALFAIWIGPKATVNKSLNKAMLGLK